MDAGMKTSFRVSECFSNLDGQRIAEDDNSGLQSRPAGVCWRHLQGSAGADMSPGGTCFSQQTEPDQADVSVKSGPDHQSTQQPCPIKSLSSDSRQRHYPYLCCDPFQKLNAWSVYNYFVH